MKVNVIVLTEYEINIDDKFKAMDLPEGDDRRDEIPTALAQELVEIAQQEILAGVYPVDEPEISEIYNPDGEILYRMGDWVI